MMVKNEHLLANTENADISVANSSTNAKSLTPILVVNGVSVDSELAELIKLDHIYHVALNQGLDLQQATCCSYTKLIAHILLEKLPPHFRGGTVEIGTIITEILGEEDKPPHEKTHQVLSLFQNLFHVFRKDLNTSSLLNRYCHLSPWLIPSYGGIPNYHSL